MKKTLKGFGGLALLGLLAGWGMAGAQPVTHVGEFCFRASGGFPQTETRDIRMDVLAYGSTTLAVHGIVVDAGRSARFTVAGTAFRNECNEIEGVLTGAARLDHKAYTASFAIDLTTGSAVYRDSQAPDPLGSGQMAMTRTTCEPIEPI